MYLEFCTKDQLRNIYQEFNTSEELVKKNVEDIMDWLEEQPHLPNVRDETFLAHFLLRCKNSMERTKQQLDLYYTSRSMMADVFSDRENYFPMVLQSQKLLCFIPLPKLTPAGQRVIAISVFKDSNFQTNSDIVLKGLQMFNDLIVKIDPSIRTIFIIDLQNLSMSLITLGIAIVKRLVLLLTKIMPTRIQKIYIVNLHPAAEPLVNLGKATVSKKLADRIEIWQKKMEDLVEVIPKRVLPSDYGGAEKPMQELRDLWAQTVTEYREWILAEEHVKADLCKRQKDDLLPNELGLYGAEGSFRKLSLD